MTLPLLHVVLHQPDIPQNTGNIGRTCVAVGAKLWLVRPLGFRLDEKHLLRAGMDYWPHLDYEVVDSWDELLTKLPSDATIWLVENAGGKLLWDAEFTRGDVLVFGSESRGLPASILDAHREHIVELPMREEVRSLNLASTVNTAVYEAVRQFGGLD
ncbi:MAG TPA: tRNA (cytidine(34)-2'-O)-methyltransferase [Planctomycetaceae bacterium]|nr:tRNA (cytidine(34)-2'-O)-methyltransferase [Planctomycetaceae bacterium]